MRFEDLRKGMELRLEIPSENRVIMGMIDTVIVSPEDEEDFWLYFHCKYEDDRVLHKKDFGTYWKIKPYNK